ncbi:DinB family protein [Melghirimyces algeriensis]|uniref:Uncharacterized damage-inducible protein DinB (Forms a four-helix bundle) n=1 Tax=Melghirimyces algeriensis TaxID=910412 RepID=A0A521E2R5_9BACL|nr:DinB family protein [Melghirimyces algeriensis]SMO78243.1 Uncharacterized damage-inducible protein DinB (forms a four-helix bundle) [Melghirimyces algeriensis]
MILLAKITERKNQVELHGLKLYEYHAWSNKRLLHHLKELPPELYKQKMPSVFPSISQALAHIYVVDSLWLSVMSGDSFNQVMMIIDQAENEVEGKRIEDMENLFLHLSERYRTFLRQQPNWNEPLSIEHPRYGKLKTNLLDLVQHVVNHGTYHRGNIAAMLRQSGHSGVPTDYLFYLFEAGDGQTC